MKKIFAILVAMVLVASLSFAVVGKKAEEPAPAEAPKVEAPVTPAPRKQLLLPLLRLLMQHPLRARSSTCTRTCKIIDSNESAGYIDRTFFSGMSDFLFLKSKNYKNMVY